MNKKKDRLEEQNKLAGKKLKDASKAKKRAFSKRRKSNSNAFAIKKNIDKMMTKKVFLRKLMKYVEIQLESIELEEKL